MICLWSNYKSISDELLILEEYILKNTASRNKLLSDAINKLLSAGGKRIRPGFVILCSKFGKYNRKKVIPVASAMEILHTATLTHDDIVDDSKLRRGIPTLNNSYGVSMALYTGDYLFTKSILMLSKNIPNHRLDDIAKIIKSVCEGEVEQYNDKFNPNVSIFSYLKRIARKTALLFASSCSIGCYIGKCTPSTTRTLAKFGFYYGMAFQIKDDINDFTLEAALSNKPVGKDIKEGVYTAPVIYSARNSNSIRKALVDYSNAKTEKSIPELILQIKNSNGISESTKLLNTYISRGIRELNKLPPNEYTDILRQLIIELSN